MNRNTIPVAVVAVALAAVAVLGGADRRPASSVAPDALPTADPEGVLSSSWFCPSGQGAAANDLTTAIDVANTTAAARSGTVTWLTAAEGTPTKQAFTVAAGAVTRVRATAAGPTPVASALVEVTGGGIVVEQVVTGGRGSAVAPCASDGSAEWYFAGGSTLVDATETFALFNPFPADAVIDIEFATDKGRVAPAKAQGYVVPAGTTRFVAVSEDAVRREEVTAAAVRARTGRLVVARVQSFDGTLGRTGVALTLAARAVAEQWAFAAAVNGPDWITKWHVYNPGSVEAQVSIDVMPESGETPEPIELTVPPRAEVVVPATREGGVASGVRFASLVRAGNGVPIVAEQSVDVRAPNARRGWSSSFGTPSPGARWAFATGDSAATGEEWLAVFNPGVEARRFVVASLTPAGRAPVATLQGVVVPAAAFVLIRLNDQVRSTQIGLDIEADGPVVAERWIYGVGRVGVSVVAGVAVPAR